MNILSAWKDLYLCINIVFKIYQDCFEVNTRILEQIKYSSSDFSFFLKTTLFINPSQILYACASIWPIVEAIVELTYFLVWCSVSSTILFLSRQWLNVVQEVLDCSWFHLTIPKRYLLRNFGTIFAATRCMPKAFEKTAASYFVFQAKFKENSLIHLDSKSASKQKSSI